MRGDWFSLDPNHNWDAKRSAFGLEAPMTRSMEPVLLTMNVGSSEDTWLRAQIRGEAPAPEPVVVQRVILQGSAEADRVYAAWARLKTKRRLPWGGGEQRAYKGE
jgi:hypothetical protein